MDPEEYTPEDLTKAYGLAAHAGDTEAMEDLHGRLLKSYQKQSAAANNPTAQGSNYLEGIGHGMARLSEGTANMLGLGGTMQKVSDWAKTVPGLRSTPLADANFTNEKLKSEDKTAEPLLHTAGGKLGDITGQVAALAPAGGVTGGATEAAGPLLAKAGPYAPQVFRTALAALEGAGQGAAMADPEHQLAGAGTGAVIGGGLSAAGSAAGKAIRGMVEKSPAAQRLVQDADEEGKELFIPISQGGTGTAKTIYQTVLPYALGVEHQLKGQSAKAKQVVSEISAEQGMPAQANAAGEVSKVKAPIGDTMEETAAGMKSAYKGAEQNTINSYAFKPQNFKQQVFDSMQDVGLPRAHRAAIAEHVNNVLGEFANEDGSISGQNLLRAKAAAEQTLPKLTSPSGSKIADAETTQRALGAFDNVVQDTINEHKILSSPTSKVPVQHEIGELGDHTVTTPNGSAIAQESGPYLQMQRIDVTPKARNTGEGIAMMEALAQKAQQGGLKFASDVSVSPDAQKLYKALQKRGYDVSQNPSEPGVNGNLVSKDPRKPVFEVGPNKKYQAASETVRDLENFQRLGKTQPEAEAVTETSEANPAGRGALKFGQLAGNSPSGSGMRSLAQDAHEVLEKESPGGVNPAGRHFFHLAEIGTGLTHPGTIPAVVGGNLLGNALATKTVQKALYGDLSAQKYLAQILRNHPQAAYSAGMAARSAANASGQ